MQDKEMKIERIPAIPKKLESIRVAAYARVSTDKDAAFHSLEAQTEYYEKYIRRHQNWQLVGVYSDNAISGTRTDRPEFLRMLKDCHDGKIDQIITKSITRFARNTIVLLETIRELKALGIDVFFEKEQMHSISPDGELLLTLLAMYAEEEARSASENQKWRIRKRFEQGKPWTGRMLGYRLKNEQLIIVPEEAEIVRQIFADYLAGASITGIAKKLSSAAIPARFSNVWTYSTVSRILANEKYTGDMILQKTYRPDFRTKKRVVNRGAVPKYEVTNSHEAIISKEDFAQVQQMLEESRQIARASNKNQQDGNTKTHLFSGLVKCGNCGGCYTRHNNGAGKYRHFVWSCRRYAEFGKNICPSRSIREDILTEKTAEVLGTKDLTHELLQEHLDKIIVAADHRLVYYFADGTQKEVDWAYKSRRESWAPEMREKARQQALTKYGKEETNNA